MVRATHLLPHTRYSDTESRHTLTLASHSRKVITFPVAAGATLEATVAQFWSSLGSSSLEVSV